jgi:3-isopropylmalate/(R)-2-methylmalate dehydratase small subunit
MSLQREPLRVVESAAVPLLVSDVDTDQIIPGRYITSRTQEEFATALFAGRRQTEADFVLNRPEMAGRSIMVAERNFGCGSSREQAVWALLAGGFRVILAPSFGDIFRTNSLQNGLLTVPLAGELCARLAEAGDVPVRVDLVAQEIHLDGEPFATFELDGFHRDLLLEGRSELDYLLAVAEEIGAHEAAHPGSAVTGGAR